MDLLITDTLKYDYRQLNSFRGGPSSEKLLQKEEKKEPWKQYCVVVNNRHPII